MKDSPLVKLTRLCNSISSDTNILKDLQQEIEGTNPEQIITLMIKQLLRNTNLNIIGVADQILPLFFKDGTITEIDLFSSETLGIKCFFMSESTMFPLHDHPNQVVVTAILYGNVKYLCLNKESDQTMTYAKKGCGKPGDIMFILDIFMLNVNEPGNYYEIVKKVGNLFYVQQKQHVFFLTRSLKIPNCVCMNPTGPF